MSNPPNNPYSQAADAYGKNSAAAATDQRTLEGRALMKAAEKLQTLSDRLDNDESIPLEEIDDTLTYNRKLWTVFASDAADGSHDLPQEIKNNIANIAVFIFKRTVEVLADPQPQRISALIDINRQIASGLLKKPPQEAGKDAETQEAKQQGAEDKKPSEDAETPEKPKSRTDTSA